MLHIVTGGSGSGKSEYAERLAVNMGAFARVYIATMRVWDEEGERRVLRHRCMRKDKGFDTRECFTELEQLTFAEGKKPVVLLECMSNLVLNEYYRMGAKAGETVIRGINALQKKSRELIVVTNETGSDGICYRGETMEYIRLLGEVNRYLGNAADSVTEVVYGIPVPIKSPG